MHPLCGADIGTLKAVFGRGGRPARGKAGTASMIWLAALARWPSTALERRIIADKLPNLREIPPPVFILGHWRSGTTHLYNIMSRDAFGYVPPLATGLPWDLFGIGRIAGPLLHRALPEHRYIDRMAVNPDSPQEDEFAIANMSSESFYHGLYFPRHFAAWLKRGLFFEGSTETEIQQWRSAFSHFMQKMALHQGKRLLIKNPVYTGRVAMLREIFPEAKFIHIHRNPYDVFVSMQNFYKKLLEVMALQDYRHVDIDAAILEVYPRMMARLEEDTRDLPASQFVEVAYKDLDERPMETVERIYSMLDLPGFEAAAPEFQRYMESVRTYRKNAFKGSAEALGLVDSHWRRYVEKWAYARPAIDPENA